MHLPVRTTPSLSSGNTSPSPTTVHLRHRSPLVLVILMDCSSSVSHSNLLIAANEPFYDQSCELLERHPELGERRSYPLILGRGRLVLSRPFGNSGRTIMELGLNQTDRTKTMLSIPESIYHWRSLRRQSTTPTSILARC